MDSTNELQERQRVFDEFKNLCKNCDQLKYQVVSNGVLDYFGRTVKGPKKISDFLKIHLSKNHEFVMDNIVVKGSIEIRPTHVETKTEPEENYEVPDRHETVEKVAQLSTSVSLESPNREQDFTTPTKNTDNQNPPIKIHEEKQQRNDVDNSSSSDSDDDSYLYCPPVKCKKLNDKSEPTNSSRKSNYTELRYLETHGMMNVSELTQNGKRRRITNSRKVRVEISYRINNSNNQIQFALIVFYEKGNSAIKSKRNLMLEFNKHANNNDDGSGGSRKPTTKCTATSTTTRKRSLRF